MHVVVSSIQGNTIYRWFEASASGLDPEVVHTPLRRHMSRLWLPAAMRLGAEGGAVGAEWRLNKARGLPLRLVDHYDSGVTCKGGHRSPLIPVQRRRTESHVVAFLDRPGSRPSPTGELHGP